MLHLRLLTFRSGAPGELTDQYLRSGLLDRLASVAGVRGLHAGRMGPSDSGPRVVASLWDVDLAPADQLSNGFPFEEADVITDRRIELYPAPVALVFASTHAAQIVRVYRGQTRPGALDDYLEHVRDGTIADVRAKRGPQALYAAIAGTDRFVTVSVWSDWQRIEQATGGNLRQPVSTRHFDRLLSGTGEHYEVVPNSAVAPDAEAPSTLLAAEPRPATG